MSNKTIVFDFDGVIHKFSKGWQDGSIYDEYNSDVISIMYSLMQKGYSVAIVSSRDPVQIVEWWNKQPFPMKATLKTDRETFYNNTKFVAVTNHKLAGAVYVDDRAITFDPKNIDHLLHDIEIFKPWNR